MKTLSMPMIALVDQKSLKRETAGKGRESVGKRMNVMGRGFSLLVCDIIDEASPLETGEA